MTYCKKELCINKDMSNYLPEEQLRKLYFQDKSIIEKKFYIKTTDGLIKCKIDYHAVFREMIWQSLENKYGYQKDKYYTSLNNHFIEAKIYERKYKLRQVR